MAWLEAQAGTGDLPDWAKRLHAVRHMPESELSAQQAEILAAQLSSLRLAAAQLLLLFSQRGEVDFIEVSQRAVQALGRAEDPTELLLKLDSQLAHVLVDEFQDTSLSQLHLLELLIAGWQPEDGRTVFWWVTRCSLFIDSVRPKWVCFSRCKHRGWVKSH